MLHRLYGIDELLTNIQSVGSRAVTQVRKIRCSVSDGTRCSALTTLLGSKRAGEGLDELDEAPEYGTPVERGACSGRLSCAKVHQI
jgi:hypothetical protein